MGKLTYLKALRISYKMALWIFKRPDLDKPFSPYYRTVVKFENCCALCEYDSRIKDQLGIEECVGCIGRDKTPNCFNGAVKLLAREGDTEKRKHCIGYIAAKLRREIRKQKAQELFKLREKTKRNLYETVFTVHNSNYPIWIKNIALRVISWIEKYV